MKAQMLTRERVDCILNTFNEDNTVMINSSLLTIYHVRNNVKT